MTTSPLAALGWDDRIAALVASIDVPAGTPDLVPGRVVRVDRGSCLVAVTAGTVRATPYALASRRAGLADEPATGDWVAVLDDPDEGWAVAVVLPRRSMISRRHSDERAVTEQVLAANVDVVAAVCALDRDFGGNRLERFLAMARASGGTPAVILTKADAADDAGATAEAAAALAPGVEVYVTSSVTGAGLDELRAVIAPGLTLVLMGPSGAGKSTLVNRLVGREAQRTEAVRDADKRGRHTTTTRDLVPVPGGGVLLDTPGLRSLGLWDAEDAVAETFPDIEELGERCRFRDCRHGAEPGCAVRTAVGEGELEARRLDSYLKLERELVALELQKDVRARRAASRRSGRIAREAQRLKGRREGPCGGPEGAGPARAPR